MWPFTSTRAKAPPPGSYGPAEGAPDHRGLARMRDHWATYPSCAGAWAETRWWGMSCYYCGRHI